MKTDRIEVHVSTIGSRYGDGSIGYPVQTLHAAMRILRSNRLPGQRAVVWVHAGVHRLPCTLTLSAADSFTTFAAWEPARDTVLEGGVEITEWRQEHLHGQPIWVAPAPEGIARSLYVDGQRIPRPRYPRTGFLRVADQAGLDVNADFVATLFDGASSFSYSPSDLPELADETGIEVVIPHYWVQERLPVAHIERDNHVVHSTRRSIFALRDDAERRFARYYLENVAHGLGEVPGEWYLDRSGAIRLDGQPAPTASPRLFYVPHHDQSPHSVRVIAPTLGQFIRAGSLGSGSDKAVNADGARVIMDSDASGMGETSGRDTEELLREIRFESLTFRYADWPTPPPSRPPYGVREDAALPRDVDFAAGVQAASEAPAAIELRGGRGCAFLDSRIEHVGGYGIELAAGCQGNLIAGSHFTDLGAGAIRSFGAAEESSALFNRANTVIDNTIQGGGRVYPHAVAVLFAHGSDNEISYNEISDFYYTGISVGWVWDYHRNPSSGNLILGNHIHHLGQGHLNDMGGIYLLGIAPGTRVTANHVHDVTCRNYGGWGIYLDEGSSHVVIEQNLVHDVASQCYHHHYGRENTIRNNIFAFGGRGQVSITRPEETVSFTMERNLLIGNATAAYVGTLGGRDVRNYTVISDLNLIWDYTDGADSLIAANAAATHRMSLTRQDAQWRATGHDRHSQIADPKFADVASRDFTLSAESPARSLGFSDQVDGACAGPRPANTRTLHPLADRTRRTGATGALRV